MTIKFLSQEAFNAGLNLLFSHNFIFDLYRSEYTLKFFTDEMINNAKTMLASRNINEGDYSVLPYEWLI